MSICILISFLIKSIGVSIGVNVAATIIIYGLAQSLIAVEAAHKILSYTPIGQSFLIFSDLSYANTLKAILVSVITILVFFILTYLSFSKEELK
jgi:ABC-type transport system involved in multi-copper enzyme maturation permease subunit